MPTAASTVCLTAAASGIRNRHGRIAKSSGRMAARARDAWRTLWQTHAPLTAAGLVLLAATAPALAGLWLDPRIIAGAPAWMKPLKFAVSTGVYALTLAWILAFLPGWPRTRRLAGHVTAAMLLLEVAIIDLQAWRGTTSHFNVGTPLDGVLFAVMGAGIMVQTIASAAVAFALWRQHFEDRATAWALRLGVTLTIAGASVGGLMTQPTQAQLDEARATGRIVTAGAHTVGGPDGGPGLPGTGWSTRHGDLRVPHFVGLHAMQALPLFAFLLRRRDRDTRLRLVLGGSAAYAVLFGLLLAQALRGTPTWG